MRAVVQRVARAEVRVGGRRVAGIGPGLLVLVGVRVSDTERDARYTADKVAHLRVFPDAQGRMNRSLLEVGGEALVVSQFTLYGDTRRGRRPSFSQAAPPEQAEPLVRAVVERLEELGVRCGQGVFGARMAVELVNDGPVTVVVESP